MSKFCFVLGLVVVLVVESSCQRYIFPTYRPPPRPRQPVIRTARATNLEASPEHPVLLADIDDITSGYTKHARSLSTPSGGRGGSGSWSSSRDAESRSRGNDASHGTGPANNRRNARSVYWSDVVDADPVLLGDVTSGNIRHVRSLSTPSGGRGRGSSSSSRDAGSRSRGNDVSHGTGPSNNRRNARSIHWSDVVADPVLPGDVTSGNIRHVRSLSTPGTWRTGSGSSSSSWNAPSRSRGNDASHGTGPANDRRTARSVQWPDDDLRTAEYPVQPVVINDATFGNIRHARSLSTPGTWRTGSGSSSSSWNAPSRSRGNDASHGTGPANDRRNARSIHWPDVVIADPVLPGDVTSGNIRHARSLSTPSAGRGRGSSSSSRDSGSRSRGNDASHGTGPSNNRRNARFIYWLDALRHYALLRTKDHLPLKNYE